MAFYDELAPYGYGLSLQLPAVRSIGWLDASHPFRTGVAPTELAGRLRTLALAGRVNQMRGTHVCELCGVEWLRRDDPLKLLGSAEIWLKSSSGYWAAPDLVIHYVEDHSYLPPDEFVRDIVECDDLARLHVSQSDVNAAIRGAYRAKA